MTLRDFDPNRPTAFDDLRAATRAKFRELLASDNLSVFAFATSTLKGVPIQAVILNAAGEVLLNEIIKTEQELDPESQAYHGILQAQVGAGKEIFELPLPRLLGESHQVITFSPQFMRDSLVRACRIEELEMFGTSHWLDGQELLATLVGSYNWTTNKWSKPKLTDCIKDLPMPAEFAPIGTALGNAQRLHALLVHFAAEPEQREVESGVCERCGLVEHCTCGVELPAGGDEA